MTKILFKLHINCNDNSDLIVWPLRIVSSSNPGVPSDIGTRSSVRTKDKTNVSLLLLVEVLNSYFDRKLKLELKLGSKPSKLLSEGGAGSGPGKCFALWIAWICIRHRRSTNNPYPA